MKNAKPEAENDVHKIFSKFDIMLGRYVLDKKLKMPLPHDSLLKFGGAFLDDFCKRFEGADRAALSAMLEGLEREPAKEEPSSKKGATPTADSPKPDLPLYSVDKAGKASGLALLRSHAFDIGSTIAFKGDDEGTVWTIVGASGSFAELKDPRSKLPVSKPIEDLVKNAQKAKPKDALVKHEHWPASRACRTAHSSNAFVKARVLYALEVLSKVVGDSIGEQVDIFVKPAKSVVSKLHISKGELVIIPEGKVVINDKGADIPFGHHEAVCMDSPPGFEGIPCFVPSTTDTAVSPWCFVDKVNLASYVNTVPMFFKVSLLGGAGPVSTKRETHQIATGAKPKAAAQPTLLHTLADVQASWLHDLGGWTRACSFQCSSIR